MPTKKFEQAVRTIQKLALQVDALTAREQDKLMFELSCAIPKVHEMVVSNADFWTAHMQAALEIIIPKSDAHNRSRKRPYADTSELVQFVNERLPRLTITEAIDEALQCDEWKGEKYEALRRRYTRNRNK